MNGAFAAELIKWHRILVCVGSGGVGKTTTAAALGVAAALAGRHALLLTIDPANRLADALGLPTLGGSAVQVPLAVIDPAIGGRLDAMRLDSRATFDGLVERLAPSPAAADIIRANRLYQNVAGKLAASESYMAVEKLYQLATEDPPDLIVLDTPPTEHALDFLEAPQRIHDVLNSRVLAILQNPVSVLGGAGSFVSQFFLGTILRVLEQFTGLHLVRDIADFVRAFDGMIDGMRERTECVARLLRAPSTAFLLVTLPNAPAVSRTEAFYRTLEKAGIPCAGLVVNRVLPREIFARPPIPPSPTAVAELPAPLAGKLLQTFADLQALATDEYAAIERLRERLALGRRLVEVPAFAGDLGSLADVARFARFITSDDQWPEMGSNPQGGLMDQDERVRSC